MHRDRSDRGEAVRVFRPGIDRKLVEGVASGSTQFLVADIWRKELAVRRVEDREIKPHLLESIVHQARDKRGRQIDSVLYRQTPPRRLTRTPIESLLPGHLGEIALAQRAQPRGPALNGLGTCRVFEIFERDRFELAPVAVRVYDLMAQSIMNRLGFGFSV